jgi:hypothetical protein
VPPLGRASDSCVPEELTYESLLATEQLRCSTRGRRASLERRADQPVAAD